MTRERWKSIPGLEGRYEVSDLGRVKSLQRIVSVGNNTGKVLVPERIRKLSPSPQGYPRVRLCGKTRLVHHLVLLAFVGPRPVGLEIRHLNGNRADSRLANLAYGTRSENQMDSIRHGTHILANKTHCAKGHPYSGANLAFDRKGHRRCRTCDRAKKRAWTERNRAAMK